MPEKKETPKEKRKKTPPMKKKLSEVEVIEKAPRVTILNRDKKDAKAILKEISKLPTMDEQQMTNLLTAIALGMIPDRFGLDISLDTRLKAIQMLQQSNQFKEQQQNKTTTVDVNINDNQKEKDDFTSTLAITLCNRKVADVDDVVEEESGTDASSS